MIRAGRKITLKVNRISDFDYHANEEGDEVLLPNRYVSLTQKRARNRGVYIPRLGGSTSRNHRRANSNGGTDSVSQSSRQEHARSTLDWGLYGKDIFLPNRNQKEACWSGVMSSYICTRITLQGDAWLQQSKELCRQ